MKTHSENFQERLVQMIKHREFSRIREIEEDSDAEILVQKEAFLDSGDYKNFLKDLLLKKNTEGFLAVYDLLRDEHKDFLRYDTNSNSNALRAEGFTESGEDKKRLYDSYVNSSLNHLLQREISDKNHAASLAFIEVQDAFHNALKEDQRIRNFQKEEIFVTNLHELNDDEKLEKLHMITLANNRRSDFILEDEEEDIREQLLVDVCRILRQRYGNYQEHQDDDSWQELFCEVVERCGDLKFDAQENLAELVIQMFEGLHSSDFKKLILSYSGAKALCDIYWHGGDIGMDFFITNVAHLTLEEKDEFVELITKVFCDEDEKCVEFLSKIDECQSGDELIKKIIDRWDIDGDEFKSIINNKNNRILENLLNALQNSDGYSAAEKFMVNLCDQLNLNSSGNTQLVLKFLNDDFGARVLKNIISEERFDDALNLLSLFPSIEQRATFYKKIEDACENEAEKESWCEFLDYENYLLPLQTKIEEKEEKIAGHRRLASSIPNPSPDIVNKDEHLFKRFKTDQNEFKRDD